MDFRGIFRKAQNLKSFESENKYFLKKVWDWKFISISLLANLLIFYPGIKITPDNYLRNFNSPL